MANLTEKSITLVTFSKPAPNVEQIFGRKYIRIKIRKTSESNEHKKYFAEFLTQTQAFHEYFSPQKLDAFIEKNAGKTFLNCVIFSDTQQTTIMASKKGHIKHSVKKIIVNKTTTNNEVPFGNNRKKNYIIPEGIPVPFLVELGVMTSDGKVVAAKYDKFRQVNRFLEFIDDVLKSLTYKSEGKKFLRVVDFGSGKSYLTFATHYFLTAVKGMQVEIIGIDLKKDVIEHCSDLAKKLGCEGLSFHVGDIADYKIDDSQPVDLMISLHACDVATDFALEFAVKNKCSAILAVPCCQHELNRQLTEYISASNLTEEKKSSLTLANNATSHIEFMPLLKYGILREKFASLMTDALRASFLETAGYSVQMLEFIDMEHTPKNILIRAVLRKNDCPTEKQQHTLVQAKSLMEVLHLSPTLWQNKLAETGK